VRSAETNVIPDVSLEEVFERREARASTLAAQTDAAAEPLRFAAGLYRQQGRLSALLREAHRQTSLSGRIERDADILVARGDPLLRFADQHGPAQLAQEARTHSRERLFECWRDDAEAFDYLSRALLRPYVELLARLGITPDRERRPEACPFCGGRAWIASRRPAPEADAALRMLGCALCGGDWPVGRICCPGCGEGDPARLPTFTEPSHPAVRIEACESCHRYVKSIDLTLDARAIPEVDDLVSVGMDLWAAREGFTRLEPGLAGL
jgi:formate dehydrogenase maturation protein FdhE